MAQVEAARERRELVDDDVRLGVRDRAGDGVGVERVGHDRRRPEPADGVTACRAARHAGHVVAGRDEARDKLTAEGAGGAGYEDLHAGLRFVGWVVAP